MDLLRLRSRSVSKMENSTEIINVTSSSPVPILLYTFSILMVLSLMCYIFVFYHILSKSADRRALHNHVIILLLIVYLIQTLFDTPFHLDYFRIGYYWPSNMIYCFSLYLLDYILYEIGALLMAWASIERHLLIFHTSLLNTRIRRSLYHYIPLSFCFIYPIIYYIYFIVYYPCNRYYDMMKLSCVTVCFLWTNNLMAFYELLVNGFVPVCLVGIFSVTLLIRVIWKKQQMGRQLTWKKNRKMAMQLLTVSVLFLVFNVGYFVIALGQMVWDPMFGNDLMVWFLSINVCAPQLIFPFLCLGTMSHLREKFHSLNPCRYFAVVHPVNH